MSNNNQSSTHWLLPAGIAAVATSLAWVFVNKAFFGEKSNKSCKNKAVSEDAGDCRLCNARNEHILNEHPRHLIPYLCDMYFELKWLTGTGGNVSIKDTDGKIYVAPSSVCKERMLPEDLFVFDLVS
jgi:hypothetical protein